MNKILAHSLLVALLAGSTAPALADGSACWYWQGDQGMTRHADCLTHVGEHLLRVEPDQLDHLVFRGKFATIFADRHGWMYVNKQGDVVVEGVMEMDNGADYVKDGFVRFVRNGKCGYASLGRHHTIRPQFDGCLPFSEGKAPVCNGCHTVTTGEHHSYKGGQSFCIDTQARRVPCE